MALYNIAVQKVFAVTISSRVRAGRLWSAQKPASSTVRLSSIGFSLPYETCGDILVKRAVLSGGKVLSHEQER